MKKTQLVLPAIDHAIPSDELPVRQLLSDVNTLLHESVSGRKPSIPTNESNVDAATRLFLEARIAGAKLKVVHPDHSHHTNASRGSITKDTLIMAGSSTLDDRFKVLGSELVQGMWPHIKEVAAAADKDGAAWDIHLLVNYIKLNPTSDAWQLYLDTRRRQFDALAPASLHAFVTSAAMGLATDLDVFCVACDNDTVPVSLFPSDDPMHDATQRTQAIVEYVYGPTLAALMTERVTPLVVDANAWMTKSMQTPMQLPFVSYASGTYTPPQSRTFAYPRAVSPLQTAPSISQSALQNAQASASSSSPTNRSFRFAMVSPRGGGAAILSGGAGRSDHRAAGSSADDAADVLLANPTQVGVWQQLSIDRSKFTATSVPSVLVNGLFVYFDDLESVATYCKKKLRLELKACVGWSVLALVSPNSWVEGTIVAFRKDDNAVQVVLTSSSTASESSWLPLDSHVRLAPCDPQCRIHAGHRWLHLVDELNAAMRTIVHPCVIPPLRPAVLRGLWRALAAPFRPADFIFSRYLRTALHNCTVLRRVFDSRPVGAFDPATGLFGFSHPEPEHLTRARCESIAAVLYDVADALAACAASGGHMELVRVFVQIVHEELDMFFGRLDASWRDTTASLEAHVESAVGLALLWDTWRHHVRAKLRLDDDHPAPSTDCLPMQWTRATFDKIVHAIDTSHLHLLQYIYLEWRRECTLSYIPNIVEQAWDAPKPYFNDTRVTAGVQCLVYRLDTLVRRCSGATATPFGTPVTVLPLVTMAWTMTLQSLSCVTALYKALEPSRARLDQFKLDLLYVVCGVYRIQKTLHTVGPPDDDDASWTTPCYATLLVWLQKLALLFAPVPILLAHVPKKSNKGAQSAAAKAAIVDNQMQVLLGMCEPGDRKTKTWQHHCLLLGGETKLFKQVELQWHALLESCEMHKADVILWLGKRKETCASSYPELTDEQTKHRIQIQELITRLHQHDEHTHNDPH
ncbi:Aste57867_22179 [Aphanomyces stellatus]|uniref:Aste57867_22179 protein n=1 Tax=Aphanomyces stellatus TaxID=120398 RepID=A0A485LJS2_9STRA|nr:hypothetical protein As57867_022110 [Aphanomyces stellatus]VFT98846.1 Aste57867_22179 [Aphanomyces stellatus]